MTTEPFPAKRSLRSCPEKQRFGTVAFITSRLFHRPRFRIWLRVRTPFAQSMLAPLYLIWQDNNLTQNLTHICDRFGQLVERTPKELRTWQLFCPQTRLNYGIRPQSRAIVSSATPIFDRSVCSPGDSQDDPVHHGASKLFVVSLSIARPKVGFRRHRHQSSLQHLSTPTELGCRTPHWPAPGLPRLRWTPAPPTCALAARGNVRGPFRPKQGASHGRKRVPQI